MSGSGPVPLEKPKLKRGEKPIQDHLLLNSSSVPLKKAGKVVDMEGKKKEAFILFYDDGTIFTGEK